MGMQAEVVGHIQRPSSMAASRVHAGRQISTAQLTVLFNQVQAATRDAEKLILGRSRADLTARPEPNSWSVAECFDHLAQTARAFLPAISNAIAGAPSLTTDRRLRTGTLAGLFIRNLEPPSRIRLKVIADIAPKHQDFETAWSDFIESQSQLSEAIHSAAGLAIDQVRVKAPVYARISYNIYSAFRMLAAHQRRHLWQSKKIFKALDCAMISFK